MSTPAASTGHQITSLGSTRPPGLVELALERCPDLERADLEHALDPSSSDDFELVVATVAGETVGWALRYRRLVMPPDWRFLRIFVRSAFEGRGIGGALHGALTGSDGVAQWRAMVFDDDDRALPAARAWGYDVVQHSVTSRVDLDAVVPPSLPAGVTVEDGSDLDFPDAADVEAMLDASQTNPERAQGIVMDLDFLRGMVGAGHSSLASLLRVDGRPVAITSGSVAGDQAHLTYTGVDPAYRGRGLGALVKQVVHVQAARMGARWCYTDNEEGNAGIRHVNASLGYAKVYGLWWMSRAG